MELATSRVDNPGSWRFFTGFKAVAVSGHCSHDCRHPAKAWIAWGPDLEHYTLAECGGCRCRAWFNADAKRGTVLARLFIPPGW